MLVPENVAYKPPLYVDKMFTPGAAMSTTEPKLLKVAKLSSFPYFVAGPSPPHLPSLSAIAATVITSGLLAGEKDSASAALFPAATTKVIPAATALWIAISSAFEWHRQPKLRFATPISFACCVT